ncbi:MULTISPECIES: hypothetical protein [Sorangium]|nr:MULTISPECIES: hypothetical protein [Sorangium]
MSASVPIVYVEANWVVAFVVAHDDAHKSSMRLLEQAKNGDCELRIPRAAVLESRGAVANAIRRFYKPFEEVRNAVAKAYRNGVAELNHIEASMNAPAVRAYMTLDTEQRRQALLRDTAINIFSDPLPELAMMDKLSSLVRMGGVDLKDFYILTSILNDRSEASRSGRQAMFFSTNKEEFEPDKKIDRATYEAYRLVWRRDFELVGGLKDWADAFP